MRKTWLIALLPLAACTPQEHAVWLEWYQVEPQAAMAYAQAIRLDSHQETPTGVDWTVWDDLAECESGGNWSINTGNGFYGGLQFTLSSWRAVGGTGRPDQNSREEQIFRAEKLKDIQGWGAWPACSRKLGLR